MRHIAPAPGPRAHLHTSLESAIETMHHARMQRRDDVAPEGVEGGSRRMEVARRTQTSDDGHREKGNRRSSDEFAPEIR